MVEHGYRQLRIFNRTKDTLLAWRAEIADSAGARLIGLLGRRNLESGGGLWLVPTNSIHTVGMRFPIDVLMLSRHAIVVGLRKSVRPFSIVWPNFRANSILELPPETISKTQTEAGDRIEIAEIEI